VVLYFYPKDDTPGCTTEALDFTRLAPDFAEVGARVLGISKDSVTKHGKFCAKHALNVVLLSDEEDDVCERYGVWGEKNMYGKTFMGDHPRDGAGRARWQDRPNLAKGKSRGPRGRGVSGGASTGWVTFCPKRFGTGGAARKDLDACAWACLCTAPKRSTVRCETSFLTNVYAAFPPKGLGHVAGRGWGISAKSRREALGDRRKQPQIYKTCCVAVTGVATSFAH
jgi:hypothetical protein